MSIESILGRLDKVRKSGRDKWRAPCVVHGGKDLNMIISERSDGSVGAYCFVCGASAVDLADTLGLDRSEVFAPDSDYKAPVITKQMESEEKQDRMIIAMAAVTPPVTLADKRRVQLAHSRLEGIQAKRDAINVTKSVAINI